MQLSLSLALKYTWKGTAWGPFHILYIAELSPSKTTIHWISRNTRNREYFGTRWKRGKVLCVYSKHNNGRLPENRRSWPTETQKDRRFQNIYRTKCPVKFERTDDFKIYIRPNVWYNSYLRFCPKGIDQCLILFLNYIIFIVFTHFIHFRFQPNPFVKTITTRLVICIYISHWHNHWPIVQGHQNNKTRDTHYKRH